MSLGTLAVRRVRGMILVANRGRDEQSWIGIPILYPLLESHATSPGTRKTNLILASSSGIRGHVESI